MTAQALREILRNEPFQPFRIRMSDGSSCEVHRKNMAFLTQRDVLVGLDETDEGVPENFKICYLLNVVAVETLDDPTGFA